MGRTTILPLERYEAETRKLMAQLAALDRRGGRHAREARLLYHEIDKTLDRWLILNELELGWNITAAQEPPAAV